VQVLTGNFESGRDGFGLVLATLFYCLWKNIVCEKEWKRNFPTVKNQTLRSYEVIYFACCVEASSALVSNIRGARTSKKYLKSESLKSQQPRSRPFNMRQKVFFVAGGIYWAVGYNSISPAFCVLVLCVTLLNQKLSRAVHDMSLNVNNEGSKQLWQFPWLSRKFPSQENRLRVPALLVTALRRATHFSWLERQSAINHISKLRSNFPLT